jgi:hypothetical protein
MAILHASVSLITYAIFSFAALVPNSDRFAKYGYAKAGNSKKKFYPGIPEPFITPVTQRIPKIKEIQP